MDTHILSWYYMFPLQRTGTHLVIIYCSNKEVEGSEREEKEVPPG
jgi:hypothetical protein